MSSFLSDCSKSASTACFRSASTLDFFFDLRRFLRGSAVSSPAARGLPRELGLDRDDLRLLLLVGCASSTWTSDASPRFLSSGDGRGMHVATTGRGMHVATTGLGATGSSLTFSAAVDGTFVCAPEGCSTRTVPLGLALSNLLSCGSRRTCKFVDPETRFRVDGDWS